MIVEEPKYCIECGDEIYGRQDKKFCSDQCRNSYNNKLNRDNINYIRNINNILRKNRRIMLKLNPHGKIKLPIERLGAKGFNFDYFTHIYTTKAGDRYHWCYDYGYLVLDKEFVLLVRKDVSGDTTV